MKRIPSWITVLPSLVVPVCLGLSLYLGLQYLIDTSAIADETVLRYLTGHPVSRVTMVMFLIGMSSLLMIGLNLVSQFSAEGEIVLGDRSSDSNESTSTDVREMAVDHGQDLLDLPNRYHSHYLWERLVNAVHSIYRNGNTANVEEELKYLSDIDQERQEQRYSLVRILIWATPMLGFLGTVLGISQALGGIAVGPDNDFQQMMDGLRGNLYIAFDTTALALTLSMVMMFAQFLIERFESQLLRLVDQRARSEISRNYELITAGFESQQVIEAIQNVVVDQTEIWRDSIRKAEQAWTASLTQTSDLVRSHMSESLDENVAALAHYLGESIEKADLSISHRWSQWQVSLSENARLMEQHLMSLAKQTDSVQKIVGSLDNSTAFDAALKHQQDAVMATTQTHRVLSELLEKVNAAGMAKDVVSKADFPVADLPVADHVVRESSGLSSLVESGPVASIKIYDEQEASVEASEEPAETQVNESIASEETADDSEPTLLLLIQKADDVASEVADEAVADEVATEAAVDEVSVDEVAVDEVAVDEVAVDEVAVDETLPTLIDSANPIQQTGNRSNSAKVTRSLLGELKGDTKSDVTFNKPQNRNADSEDTDSSNGNRRAA